jgi:hypothetical protein
MPLLMNAPLAQSSEVAQAPAFADPAIYDDVLPSPASPFRTLEYGHKPAKRSAQPSLVRRIDANKAINIDEKPRPALPLKREPTSFNHLVGAEQDGGCCSLNAERLGCPEIHR